MFYLKCYRYAVIINIGKTVPLKGAFSGVANIVFGDIGY